MWGVGPGGHRVVQFEPNLVLRKVYFDFEKFHLGGFNGGAAPKY